MQILFKVEEISDFVCPVTINNMNIAIISLAME